MFQRTSLCAGEDSHIDEIAHWADISFCILQAEWIIKILFQHDDTAAGPAKRFMGGRSYKMTMFERRAEQALGDQTGRMGHIAHNQGAGFVCDLPDPGIIPVTAIGG